MKKASLRLSKKSIGAISIVGLLLTGGLVSPAVFADKYQDQINSLSNQNANKQNTIGQLDAEAASLQDKISKLQAEIANLQTQITTNEAERDETIAKIAKAEADLAQQREYLASSLKAMYVDGDITSMEMLASSQNINDFVDQEQYQRSVQGQVQRTLDTIKQMKAQLDSDKATLERMIANLNDMRARADSQKTEESRLLSLNEAQQTALDNQIKANNSKIADLRKQQVLENARLMSAGSKTGSSAGKIPVGVAGGGGYPGVWAFAPMDSLIDSWGMYNRECVSWTAYKVAASGRYMPYWGGRGNAKQWDDNARAAGIPVDGNPRAGDVAVSNSGTWGHVMYVESVTSDGSINVSDYNQQYDGLYRAYTISADTIDARGLVFIHF